LNWIIPSWISSAYRQSSQDVPEEIRGRDLRRELEVRERTAREKGRERSSRGEGKARVHCSATVEFLSVLILLVLSLKTLVNK